MKTTLTAAARWCGRVLARTWFFISESDPPEKPKPGLRIFGPRPRREPPQDTASPPEDR